MRVTHLFERQAGVYSSVHRIQDDRLDALGTHIGSQPMAEGVTGMFYPVGTGRMLKFVQIKRGAVNTDEDPITTYAGDDEDYSKWTRVWFTEEVEQTRAIRAATGLGPVIIDAWTCSAELVYYNAETSATVDDVVGFMLMERPPGCLLKDFAEFAEHYDDIVENLRAQLDAIVEKTGLLPYDLSPDNLYVSDDLRIGFAEFDGTSDDSTRFRAYYKDIVAGLARLRAKRLVETRLRKRAKK